MAGLGRYKYYRPSICLLLARAAPLTRLRDTREVFELSPREITIQAALAESRPVRVSKEKAGGFWFNIYFCPLRELSAALR